MPNIGLKFERTYTIIVGPFVITLPLTLDFDITRSSFGHGVGQFRIKNLDPLIRSFLRKDLYDYSKVFLIEVIAGYQNETAANIASIFRGTISQCWSVREGTDFVTQIECFDGGLVYTNNIVSLNFPAGTPMRAVIQALIATMAPTVLPGAIGNFTTILKKATSFSGNAVTLLREITGGGFFIDNGRANAIQNSEYIAELGPVLISPETGLLGTPLLEQHVVRVEMMFEPSVQIGQYAVLNTTTLDTKVVDTFFLGKAFKITSVKHRGTISAAVCGSATTSVEFFYNKVLTPTVAG